MYIDGEFKEEIDTYSNLGSGLKQSEIYRIEGLENGEHTIKIETSRRKIQLHRGGCLQRYYGGRLRRKRSIQTGHRTTSGIIPIWDGATIRELPEPCLRE